MALCDTITVNSQGLRGTVLPYYVNSQYACTSINSNSTSTYTGITTLQDIIDTFGNMYVENLTQNMVFGKVSTFDITMRMSYDNYISNKNKKEKTEMENRFFNGMFGKLPNGTCRLSTSGEVAVRTSNGYKYYSTKSKRPVNCDQFVFDIGDDFFFLFPTNKVEAGDILLINDKPKYVIKTEENMITVLNYEDSTVETIIPEQHIFMGNSYCYAKIMSMFGNSLSDSDKGMKKIMRYMMLTEMMKGSNSNGMNSMLPLMLMGNDFGDMFDGLFDFSGKDETEHVDGETDKRTEIKD